LSATLSHRYFIPHGSNAILNYLHIDLAAVVGAALVILLGAGLTGSIDLPVSGEEIISTVTLSQPLPQGKAEKPRPTLSSAMSTALDFVSQRYRVSPTALQPVFEAVQKAARERNLDPLLIVAVISIESGFNPYAQSNMGAQGLMQIIPRYHQDKLAKAGDKASFLDPVTNVELGAQILHEAIRRHGDLRLGLQYYGGASDDQEQAYANKVMTEKQRLEQLSRRRDTATG
jgi:hypothetical protein